MLSLSPTGLPTVGALFFSGRRPHSLPTPRYFFAIVYSRQEIADPLGTVLPDDVAAAEYAEKLLAGLRAESRRNSL
jgi:hypothetical protein